MSRYFAHIAYNGKPFHGWQEQENAITVQGEIQRALSLLLKQKIEIVGAGRTDTGVHARSYYFHFDWVRAQDFESLQSSTLNPQPLLYKLNNFLSHEIVIYDIFPVKPDAHARFSALSRTYKYYINYQKNPFQQDFACYYYGKLDLDLMNQAAQKLFDYTDFTCFSKLHSQTKTNNCKIMQAFWTEENGQYVFTIQADRFLRNMVRAIVGTLFQVGLHKISIEEFCQIIESKNRCNAGTSMPAHALFLEEVEYDWTQLLIVNEKAILRRS